MNIKIPELYAKKTEKPLLRQTEILFPSHGLVLVRGKNGCGKTTLMKEIFRNQSETFSMLCQENDLILGDLSVLDNINMFQGNQKEIVLCLEDNNLTHLLDRPAHGLSGGECRVISVLRTLFSPRDYIILDEPSNDIDNQTFEILFQLFQKFSKNKTIIIVSHDNRFTEIDYVYEIQNQELMHQFYSSTIKNHNEPSIKNDLSDFKSDKHNPTFLIYSFLMFLILGYSLITGVSTVPLQPYTKYQQNTYRVASMMATDLEAFNDVDAMNTILLRAALKFNKIDFLRKASKSPEELGQGLPLQNKTFDKIYPLEYYDSSGSNYWNVERTMISILADAINVPTTSISFRKNMAEVVSKDVSKIQEVTIPLGWNEKIIEKALKPYGYTVRRSQDPVKDFIFTFDFSRSLYNTALGQSKGGERILVDAVVLKRNSISFLEFLESNGLTKKAYLIQGNEIYKTFDEANRFLQWYQTIQSLVRYLSLSFICLALMGYIFERSQVKRYKILYFYGFSKKALQRRQAETYYLRKINALLAILSITIGVVLFYIINSYFIIFAIVFFAAGVKLSCKVVWEGVNLRIWKGM